MEVPESSYWIGSIYTGMMPERKRAELGAYYTPPPLCERLLDMATNAHFDWRNGRVLDPACGGNCSDLWGSTGHQASHRGAAKHGICFASRLVPSNVNSYASPYLLTHLSDPVTLSVRERN